MSKEGHIETTLVIVEYSKSTKTAMQGFGSIKPQLDIFGIYEANLSIGHVTKYLNALVMNQLFHTNLIMIPYVDQLNR